MDKKLRLYGNEKISQEKIEGKNSVIIGNSRLQRPGKAKPGLITELKDVPDGWKTMIKNEEVRI